MQKLRRFYEFDGEEREIRPVIPPSSARFVVFVSFLFKSLGKKPNQDLAKLIPVAKDYLDPYREALTVFISE